MCSRHRCSIEILPLFTLVALFRAGRFRRGVRLALGCVARAAVRLQQVARGFRVVDGRNGERRGRGCGFLGSCDANLERIGALDSRCFSGRDIHSSAALLQAHFNKSVSDVHDIRVRAGRDSKPGALDHGGQQRRVHPEVRHGLAVNLVKRGAGILPNGGHAARTLCDRQARIGGQIDLLGTIEQDRRTLPAGRDDRACGQTHSVLALGDRLSGQHDPHNPAGARKLPLFAFREGRLSQPRHRQTHAGDNDLKVVGHFASSALNTEDQTTSTLMKN